MHKGRGRWRGYEFEGLSAYKGHSHTLLVQSIVSSTQKNWAEMHLHLLSILRVSQLGKLRIVARKEILQSAYLCFISSPTLLRLPGEVGGRTQFDVVIVGGSSALQTLPSRGPLAVPLPFCLLMLTARWLLDSAIGAARGPSRCNDSIWVLQIYCRMLFGSMIEPESSDYRVGVAHLDRHYVILCETVGKT